MNDKRKKELERLKEKKKEYLKNRRKNDDGFKIRQSLRNKVQTAIKNNKESAKVSELLGCTVEQARKHLESQFKEGMSWDNYGLKGWHIDHVTACMYFDLTDEEQQKECFHYTNLQPLWAEVNWSKGAELSR
ncbi:hypothetical protein ABEY41_28125 [Peribacillus butanolivorans]|uniref:hypothetical protein n=1 Tax=Peribacillus butanolivorans TaxID=421767 RepID=UPI00364C9EAE